MIYSLIQLIMPTRIYGTSTATTPSEQALLVPDGSAASPGISFKNDNTSGFFLLDGNIGVSVQGVHIATVHSEGVLWNGNIHCESVVANGSALTNIGTKIRPQSPTLSLQIRCGIQPVRQHWIRTRQDISSCTAQCFFLAQ